MSYDGIVMHAMVNQLNKKFQGAKIQKILHPRKDEIHLVGLFPGPCRRSFFSVACRPAFGVVINVSYLKLDDLAFYPNLVTMDEVLTRFTDRRW